ncbi:MAG: hypothetical protein ACYSW0_13220 [Planctomycetota bacterium]|jgi:hypothetical protein
MDDLLSRQELIHAPTPEKLTKSFDHYRAETNVGKLCLVEYIVAVDRTAREYSKKGTNANVGRKTTAQFGM